VAGVLNRQERVYRRGMRDRQGRSRASSLKVVVDVPNVNSMISPSGRKRKGLHHGANRSQPVGFSRCYKSVIRSDWASLIETSVSRSSLAKEGWS